MLLILFESGVVFGVWSTSWVTFQYRLLLSFFIGAHITNRQARHKNILHDNAALQLTRTLPRATVIYIRLASPPSS